MTKEELQVVLKGLPDDAEVQIYGGDAVDRPLEEWTAEIRSQRSRIVLGREQFYS